MKKSLDERMLRRIQRQKAVAQYRGNLISIAPVEVLIHTWIRLMHEVKPKYGRITNDMSYKVGEIRMESLVKSLSIQQPEFIVLLGVAAHEWGHFLGFGERKARKFEREVRAFLARAIEREYRVKKQ